MIAERSPLAVADTLVSMIHVMRLEDLIPPEELESGVREIEAKLLLVASEALNASLSGVPLRIAACDFERYPHMARLHASVEDILTLELPKPLLDWASRFFDNGPPEELDGLRTDLVRRATNDAMPLRRELFRFLLFQGVRLNLVFGALVAPNDVFGVGMGRDDLDEIAEAEMTRWLEQPVPDTDDVRPFTVMVAAALEELAHESELMRLALGPVKDEFRIALARRARIEAALASMNAPDALIIRNEFADEFEVQALKIETLRTRHPVAFARAKRGALYQRKSEMMRSRSAQALLVRRRRQSLLDVIARRTSRDGGRR